jgi:acylglycerol lipase
VSDRSSGFEPAIKQFVTSDGYEHHYRHWQPDVDRPKGFVVALHGIQSHSGWFKFTGSGLCEAGYEVFFIDRRGSGLNEQERGHARHRERLVNDVVQMLSYVRGHRNETAPTVPVTLLGLSWGGKLASMVAAHRPELLDGLVLPYPGIRSHINTSCLNHLRLSLARRFEVFEKRVRIPLDDPALFTSEPKWQDYIRNDKLALHDVTVAFLLANRQLDRRMDLCRPYIRCPVLMMLAGRDRIVENTGTRQWFDALATQERKLIEYPNASHTLEFDTDRATYRRDLIAWLDGLQKIT